MGNAWKFGATWPASLNSGKDLTFQGGGTVVLENTVNQGLAHLLLMMIILSSPLILRHGKAAELLLMVNILLTGRLMGLLVIVCINWVRVR